MATTKKRGKKSVETGKAPSAPPPPPAETIVMDAEDKEILKRANEIMRDKLQFSLKGETDVRALYCAFAYSIARLALALGIEPEDVTESIKDIMSSEKQSSKETG